MRRILFVLALLLSSVSLQAQTVDHLRSIMYFSDGHVEEGLTDLRLPKFKMAGTDFNSFNFKADSTTEYRKISLDELSFAQFESREGGTVLFSVGYRIYYKKSETRARNRPEHKSLMLVRWMNESCVMGSIASNYYNSDKGLFTQMYKSQFPPEIGFRRMGHDENIVIGEYSPYSSTNEFLVGTTSRKRFYRDIRKDSFEHCPEFLNALLEEEITLARPREFILLYQKMCGSSEED